MKHSSLQSWYLFLTSTLDTGEYSGYPDFFRLIFAFLTFDLGWENV